MNLYKGTTVRMVYWDAVTTYLDGSALNAGEVVYYKVYLKDAKGNITLALAATVDTQAQINLPGTGQYSVGVQAMIPSTATDPESGDSNVAWSDVDANCSGGTGFEWVFKQLNQPQNLKGE